MREIFNKNGIRVIAENSGIYRLVQEKPAIEWILNFGRDPISEKALLAVIIDRAKPEVAVKLKEASELL